MIYIKNFPSSCRSELLTLFEKFGGAAVVSLTRGCGLVRMQDREEALDAISHLNGHLFEGHRLSVGPTRRPG
ncbi:MAG: RNA recognition motif domain-containing protein [Vulcanimicrobiota bacterium]